MARGVVGTFYEKPGVSFYLLVGSTPPNTGEFDVRRYSIKHRLMRETYGSVVLRADDLQLQVCRAILIRYLVLKETVISSTFLELGYIGMSIWRAIC